MVNLPFDIQLLAICHSERSRGISYYSLLPLTMRDVSTPVDMTEADTAKSADAARILPKHLLYSIFARIGGPGLDTDSFEALRASYRGGFLGKAIAYDNRPREIPSRFIQSLRWHPVRLISFLDRPYYYGAKKKYLDWIASRHLDSGRYDFFHSWSGDCLETLRVATKRKIPSLIEIPTWHRGSQPPSQSSGVPEKTEISVQRSEVRS